MLRKIDPGTHAVVDLRDFCEINGAVAADEETGEVYLIKAGFEGPQQVGMAVPTGIRIVRRPWPRRRSFGG